MMYNSGVIKVYDDEASKATFVEFSPPSIKIAFSWISLQQLVTSDAVAQEFARQMVKHYQALFEARWHDFFAQQHQGKEGLLIPALNGYMSAQVVLDETANWEKFIKGNVFEKFFQSMTKKAVGEDIDTVLGKGIPGFHTMMQRCPVKGCENAVGQCHLRDTIIHLNDQHKWPREQIADWLDTLDHDLRFKVSGGGEEDGSDH